MRVERLRFQVSPVRILPSVWCCCQVVDLVQKLKRPGPPLAPSTGKIAFCLYHCLSSFIYMQLSVKNVTRNMRALCISDVAGPITLLLLLLVNVQNTLKLTRALRIQPPLNSQNMTKSGADLDNKVSPQNDGPMTEDILILPVNLNRTTGLSLSTTNEPENSGFSAWTETITNVIIMAFLGGVIFKYLKIAKAVRELRIAAQQAIANAARHRNNATQSTDMSSSQSSSPVVARKCTPSSLSMCDISHPSLSECNPDSTYRNGDVITLDIDNTTILDIDNTTTRGIDNTTTRGIGNTTTSNIGNAEHNICDTTTCCICDEISNNSANAGNIIFNHLPPDGYDSHLACEFTAHSPVNDTSSCELPSNHSRQSTSNHLTSCGSLTFNQNHIQTVEQDLAYICSANTNSMSSPTNSINTTRENYKLQLNKHKWRTEASLNLSDSLASDFSSLDRVKLKVLVTRSLIDLEAKANMKTTQLPTSDQHNGANMKTTQLPTSDQHNG